MLPSVHNKGSKIPLHAGPDEPPFQRGIKISSNDFYGNYHGHLVPHLKTVRDSLAAQGANSFVYLMGDSSLDNKFWLLGQQMVPSCNGYENILAPPKSVADVAYWMNFELAKNAPGVVCVNCSVEESTISSRDDRLLPQDAFVEANVTSNDVIIISLGGNDIALRPSFKTICSMGWLAKASWNSTIQSGSAWGMGHLRKLFRDQIRGILQSVCSASRPKAILVCMIYFPDITGRGGWADRLLGILGYDSNPDRLQSLIRTAFLQATSEIKLDGTLVIPTPLFEVLDGQISNDYVQRVEPSAQGGRKMAGLFMKLMQQHGILARK